MNGPGRLHVLTDLRPGRDPLPVVAGALAGGADAVQVRAKGVTDRELYDVALRVAGMCARAGALCVVDDRADVALAVGAAGTHLGGTAREPAAARALVAQGASYLGVGPAYATTTKDGLPDPLGPAGVAAVAGAVPVPVLAIGGVTAQRVGELLAAGAYGVAVVTAVSDAADPAEATRRLRAALDRSR